MCNSEQIRQAISIDRLGFGILKMIMRISIALMDLMIMIIIMTKIIMIIMVGNESHDDYYDVEYDQD